MNESSKQFLYKYLNNASPTGFEASGQQIWLDYIKPYIDERELQSLLEKHYLSICKGIRCFFLPFLFVFSNAEFFFKSKVIE